MAYIDIDKYGNIKGYSVFEPAYEGMIEIDLDIDGENIKNLYIKDNQVLVKPNKPEGLMRPLWNGVEWVESATLEEQLELWKKKIINLTREINLHKEAGFYDSSLESDLEYAKKQHMEVSHELALQINLTY